MLADGSFSRIGRTITESTQQVIVNSNHPLMGSLAL
jgi:hypothetical protein